MSEHILQFGVCIDDHAIEEKAIDMASKDLAKKVEDRLFGYNGYTRTYELSDMAEKIWRDNLEELKPYIIEKTAEKLANAMGRSKKYKDAVVEAIREADNG